LWDWLPRLHERKGRRWVLDGGGPVPTHAHSRPWRDRAIVYVLLSTGLRREELVRLDLDQIAPADAPGLRNARRARLSGVRGKGGSERHVFLSSDARTAVADYLERERQADQNDAASALFLTAATIRSRSAGGRLSPRAVNLVLARIGGLHDAEVTDPARRISPLRPHDYADLRVMPISARSPWSAGAEGVRLSA
jgi:site-specific recombinase XerD